MDSFQNPVGSQSKDPYERYRVESVEKEKQAKEEAERELAAISPKKLGMAVQMLLAFRKFIEFFEDTSEKGISASSEKEVRENLIRLKAALEILKREDRSQDIEFLNVLSKLWDLALEDALRFKRATPIALQFKSLIKKIQSYPQNQEHTLGYYLTEHAGQKWIPFPYMEMIQKLHTQHQKNPKESTLDQWTQTISNLITSFSNLD